MNLQAIGIILSSGLPVRSQGGNSLWLLTYCDCDLLGWYYFLPALSVWYGSWQLVRSVLYLPVTPLLTQMPSFNHWLEIHLKKSIHCERDTISYLINLMYWFREGPIATLSAGNYSDFPRKLLMATEREPLPSWTPKDDAMVHETDTTTAYIVAVVVYCVILKRWYSYLIHHPG